MPLLFLLLTTSSCRKFIEVEPPIDKLSAEVVFTDVETATSAVTGIYTNMLVTLPVISSGGVTVYTGLTSDELYSSNTTSTTLAEFASNAISPGNSVLKNDFWQKGFNLIYHANACTEGLENNTYLPVQVRDQLLGEVYLCRAFIYYYFVNLFGDVPLLLKTDYQENQKAARTATTTVYGQIITDLKNAQALLGTSYPTNERVRPNKWAATALLAKVYLILGQWTLAEQESSSIINSGDYSLEPDPNNVFLATSNEAIWQIMPTRGYNTTEGLTFIPANWSSGPPNFPLTDYLISSFETDDLRKSSWVSSKTVQGQTYYYPHKYKIGAYGQPVTEYYMVFRLAEQYLIRSESLTWQQKIDKAKNDLDIIRKRAGLPDTPASTTEELLAAMAHERRIELFAEWGNRWIDLKRTKKSADVLSPIKAGWQPTDTLFPIPLEEIQRNPSLAQNPGY
ncbi:RagB/SusD family nutrient uptake outer membrane protein [Agriterribacter sp.]|uniref:RagB/SusD family nutrient uptake outer membrane protein n=1 Tax=Agriterribacter sp. TaxID=2821509 RepID=UPI002C292DA5|nr:RagB/SusD family nutrient uptake outer membrane protein [Agriterribacter sp.]HRO46339.1 RagB/SusD family nutrient uptake outer membrane protein [Agriterribacter sp.]HRQ17506.1 RagB/SusD family nutrient uptake outer membrane protein [Agriterribacter sp.]